MNAAESSTALARVRYSEGQRITPSDLAAEQQYLIAARRRHNLAQHDWGVVDGLRLADNFGTILLQPGFAVDAYGRELIVSSAILIPPQYLVQLDADTVAAFLVYSLAGMPACGTSGARSSEEALVRLEVIASLADFDPRRPPDVPATQLMPGPQDMLPDDPSIEWPVFLGFIQRDNPGANTFHVDTELPDRRPYAGSRGQEIESPSGYTEVRVGAEAQDDTRAFAVSMLDAAGKMSERLSLDAGGNAALRGTVQVLRPDPAVKVPANMRIQRADRLVTNTMRAALGGCADAGAFSQPRYWGAVFGQIDAPKVAAPWQVYRVQNPPPQAAPAEGPSNELRFEFLDPGKTGNRKNSRFAIGYARAQGFNDCLSVDANCTVTIRNGTLRVKGDIVLGPLTADPSNPLLQAILVSGWLQGLLGNSGQVSQYYGAAISMGIALPDEGFVGQALTCTVTVTNTGNAAIRGVVLAETHTLSGATATLPAGFDVDTGATVTKQITYTLTASGTLGVTVSAAGRAATGGYQVTATAQGSVDVVEPAQIHAQIQSPPDGVANVAVPYTVTISNPGPADLSHVTATEQVTSGGATPVARDLMVDESLAISQSRPFSRNATQPTVGVMTLQINCNGSGPGKRNSATSADNKTVQIRAFQLSVTHAASAGSVTVDVTNASSEDLTITSIAASAAGVTFGPIAPPSTIAGTASASLALTYTPTGAAPFTLTLTIHAKRPSGVVFTETPSIAV